MALTHRLSEKAWAVVHLMHATFAACRRRRSQQRTKQTNPSKRAKKINKNGRLNKNDELKEQPTTNVGSGWGRHRSRRRSTANHASDRWINPDLPADRHKVAQRKAFIARWKKGLRLDGLPLRRQRNEYINERALNTRCTATKIIKQQIEKIRATRLLRR